MRIKAKLISLTGGMSESLICFAVKGKDALFEMEKYKDKEVFLELKKESKKRSLNSNAYFWTLCEKIASVVGTSKDEVYLDMLDQYGVFTHIVAKPEAVDRIVREFRICRVLGEVIVDGKEGIEIQCYYGSSGYNQKEMCRLIEGVVAECRDLGIETMTPDEISLMNSRWAV